MGSGARVLSPPRGVSFTTFILPAFIARPFALFLIGKPVPTFPGYA